jgi:hypothetical protein
MTAGSSGLLVGAMSNRPAAQSIAPRESAVPFDKVDL